MSLVKFDRHVVVQYNDVPQHCSVWDSAKADFLLMFSVNFLQSIFSYQDTTTGQSIIVFRFTIFGWENTKLYYFFRILTTQLPANVQYFKRKIIL